MRSAISKKLSALLIITMVLINGATSGLAIASDDAVYTEDLVEITDRGVFDTNGNPVPIQDQKEEILSDLKQELEPLSVPSGDSFDEYRETIINSWGGTKAYAEKRLEKIREQLKDELNVFDEFNKKIDDAEVKLIPLREEIKTLTDQVDLFNGQLRFTREKISNAELQIAEKQIEMKRVLGDIQTGKVSLDIQRKAVLEYINLLYHEESQYMELYTEGTSSLKLLLADASVSENLMGKEYVAIMEDTGRKVFHDLEESYLDLREKQATLLLSQTKLNRLYVSLDQEKKILEETRKSKKDLLEEAKTQGDYYEKLLEESIHQQLESALAIQNMKDNIGLIESKLTLLDKQIAKEEEAKLSEGESGVPASPSPEIDFITLTGESETLSWPVPPVALTATFHDPTYPAKWGVHQAIDIRARQFTEIHAPANGYVVEAKDNGMGYSYIILAHKKNLVTVYGHVYESLVKPGMLVKKGDVIGLSGGTPGTKGAGMQTTGPHLHFEVHYKGEPVNPLDYLPVYELPIEYIPAEYLLK